MFSPPPIIPVTESRVKKFKVGDKVSCVINQKGDNIAFKITEIRENTSSAGRERGDIVRGLTLETNIKTPEVNENFCKPYQETTPTAVAPVVAPPPTTPTVAPTTTPTVAPVVAPLTEPTTPTTPTVAPVVAPVVAQLTEPKEEGLPSIVPTNRRGTFKINKKKKPNKGGRTIRRKMFRQTIR